MENNKKQKRYYKVNEIVWSIDLKKEVKVDSINKDDLTVVVKDSEGNNHTFPLWRIDVLKYKAKSELKKKRLDNVKNSTTLNDIMHPKVYFAKIDESAIIPTKRSEDGGFDIYANVKPFDKDGKEVFELLCKKGETTLVTTKIAVAMPKTHFFNTKHERGSTAKIGLSVLAGVVDSGYRGEIFIAVSPLSKSVLISSEYDNVVEKDDLIIYPYSKAICQATIDLVPDAKIEVIDYNELLNMKSERGVTKLGQSGK